MGGFINALPSALSQGLIWGIMAIGLYITYKMLDLSDLTVDGSLCTGGAVCVMMMLAGYNVWIAMLAAFVVGMLTGWVTSFFHTKLGIPAILSGILTTKAMAIAAHTFQPATISMAQTAPPVAKDPSTVRSDNSRIL